MSDSLDGFGLGFRGLPQAHPKPYILNLNRLCPSQAGGKQPFMFCAWVSKLDLDMPSCHTRQAKLQQNLAEESERRTPALLSVEVPLLIFLLVVFG